MNEHFLKSEPDFNTDNNKKYDVKAIKDNIVYTKKAERDLPGLYYLFF